MDRATYEIEAEVEERHWWFRGRRRILRRLLRGRALPAGARVLDVGCGTGANGPVLAEDGRRVVGVDASVVPIDLAMGKGHAARLCADATALPFPDASFDLVCALDVLEHIDDDAAAAQELSRVLSPGGTLVVFVPALRILWGLQDEVSHHRRRYHRSELVRLLQGAGLFVERTTFFNTILFPPILAARLAMRVLPRGNLQSENELGGPMSNAILAALFAAEAPLLSRVNFPIGVSLAAVAQKR